MANPNSRGQQRDKPWRDALRMAVNEDTPDGFKKLRKIAEACADAAIAGDMQAVKEIGDRLDGKVPQAIVGDDEESAINVIHRIERVIVRPKAANG